MKKVKYYAPDYERDEDGHIQVVMNVDEHGGYVAYSDYDTIKGALDIAAGATAGMALKIRDLSARVKELEAELKQTTHRGG